MNPSMLILQNSLFPITSSGLSCLKTAEKEIHGAGPSGHENHADCAAQDASDKSLRIVIERL
jgi:hypothetical protein